MIDVDQLEHAVAQAPGDDLLVSKAQIRQMLAAIRKGQTAERTLVNMRSMASAAISTGGMRVSGGYPPPNRPSAP